MAIKPSVWARCIDARDSKVTITSLSQTAVRFQVILAYYFSSSGSSEPRTQSARKERLLTYPKPARLYKGVDFVDKRYKLGPAPGYDHEEWLGEKFTLGLEFPNLPYYIDGDVKLTQSLAILRYLSRKYGLAANLDRMNDKEMVELDVLEQQAGDLVSSWAKSLHLFEM
ncbi:hypothetical protein HPB49_009185 [Dermacentor silvarum]|uniref:Uncharacterized protein n=1 Tax=Dermacentor silvarum TaxID=543639 RepID=A0ACB8CE00_DERSI|nr:hypothetical protein HPB49_009185 [Dermacentor silvarum]